MNKVFNWKISLISIIGFGLITFIINLNGVILLTIFAALKEMLFRLFWGGFSGRLLQRIGDHTTGIKSYLIAAIIPTILVFTLTFVLHYFTLTPNPMKTVGVNTVLTFISGIATMFLFKRGLMRV